VQEIKKQQASHSFPPIVRPDARILILGSLPGRRSLQEQQYYAHPQNAFWRIMAELVGAEGNYQRRCESLMDSGIALWDVLAESVRPGSMDSDIRLETAISNDFVGLFGNCPQIGQVCFNGRKAAAMFERFVGLDTFDKRFETLPSTSPAYASMPYSEKLERWRSALK
jgi:hypoxanthine-DNA glycosylase